MLSESASFNRIQVFSRKPVDGQALKSLTEAGLTWLRTNQQTVNSLNVFPVPDGDTGTNMVLTMQAAWDEISNSPERNIGKLTHMVAHGALMGARGNSGVILSQLWRGFARALDSIEVLDGKLMLDALHQGRNTAYKGVVKPVEGTILTVAKDIDAEAARSLADTHDPYDILDRIVVAADASVEKTPDLLAVLKEAGVVDAGGKGLFFILEGMQRFVQGLPLDDQDVPVGQRGPARLRPPGTRDDDPGGAGQVGQVVGADRPKFLQVIGRIEGIVVDRRLADEGVEVIAPGGHLAAGRGRVVAVRVHQDAPVSLGPGVEGLGHQHRGAVEAPGFPALVTEPEQGLTQPQR